MAIPRGMAEGPRTEPIARVDRGAAVQQFSGQAGTVFVRRREQCERHLDSAQLCFFNSKPIIKPLASFGVGGASNQRSAQYSNYARAQK